ncbi:hypothetical protein OG891_21350 [Streptomyces sp. NBC_01637]|nr:hypothetical protein OH719_25520 [Streptomyces sp. NBC_01653]WTD89943.1 hypothetical protein OG891_21350 [Streptomyces sp. NBC_01637]
MKTPTFPGPPAELPQSFETDPLPVPGCDVCAALVRARAAARSAGDMSNVSDLNVEIRRHPHGTRRRPS